MEKRHPQHIFGEVVRQLRQARGISQEALAAEAGLHRTYISLLERGLRNPSLTVIQQLADALRVSITELISEFDNGSNRGAS